ncbi:Ig-like domain-containing protein [uncultured Robinsoniella sp.]|uniref:Ig-like domain-containing protein n=3 Tax=Robinsoniella TaxID=588605 RepID=UPI00374F4C2A
MKSKKLISMKRIMAWILTLCMILTAVQIPIDVQAAVSEENAALGKSVSLHKSDGTDLPDDYRNPDRPAAMAVDGIIDATGEANYCELGKDGDKTAMYLQIDLGGLYDLSRVNMWRYWKDGRTYDATVITTSESGDFTDAAVIYNSDKSNVHGFGGGRDDRYAETASGHEFTVPDGTKAQAVRVYVFGSMSGTTNHINEVQVWGTADSGNPEAGTYTVTIPTGSGYQVIPFENDPTTVEEGGSFRFQVLIDTESGYSATSAVKANGVELEAVDTVYTIENITENQSITVEGVHKAQYEVTFPENPQGYSVEIQNGGSTTVDYNGSISFKLILDEAYDESVPVVKANGGTALEKDELGVYTIANIQDDLVITVEGIQENTVVKTKTIYLSDIDWKSATNAVGAAGEKETPTKDLNHLQEPIKLLVDGTEKTFDKGIGIQTDSSIVYDLEDMGYTSFHTMTGVDYSAIGYVGGEEGCDVQFKIYLDGEAVFDSGIVDASNNAQEFNIALTPENKELKLEAKMVSQPYNDWGNWADASFEMAYPEPTNIALNKTVTVKKTADNSDSEMNSGRPTTMAVDGIIGPTSDANYCDFGQDGDNTSRYLQVDLGDVYELTQMNMWRYWGDSRVYNGTVIAVSENPDFSNPTIIYNSDKTDKHGLGAGSDDTYAETQNGKSFAVPEGTMGRYVRVYMAGSNKGTTNHIVELQVMGYYFSTEPKPYEANAFENAEVYLDMPTHFQDLDSNKNANGTLKHIGGQVTHPDIQVFDQPWNGYKYWMIYTPNTMITSQYENPYIVASEDGQTWVEPEGISNPIEPEPPSTRYHNCDADLLYDSVNDRLLAYWNWADDGGGVDDDLKDQNCQIRLRISYDGINWGVPYDKDGNIATTVDTVARMETGDTDFIPAISETDRYGMLSPTFTYDEFRGIYVMWAQNSGDGGYNQSGKFIDMRWSEDGINWSEPQKVKNFLGKDENGRQLWPWHQDIQYIPELQEYWGLSQCFSTSNPDGSVLYLTKSRDGINWEQAGTQPVLRAGKSGTWDDFQIYRSTFYYDNQSGSPTGGKFRIWYSALQANTSGKTVMAPDGTISLKVGTDDTRIWRIGYTENDYMEVMKALTQDKNYEEAELVNASSLNLSMDKTSISVGEEATVSTAFVPENATDRIVKYTSKNPDIATIDAMGIITGVKNGTATIAAETQSGAKGELSVTVGELQRGEIRYEVSNDHPMYLENYYWSDDAPRKDGLDANKNYYGDERVDSPVMLYNTVPEELRDNTVILLIAERSLNSTDAVREWIKKNVELCNENKIPCAVQIANGETNVNTTIPLSFWNELANNNEYLVGFNAAEMYNRFAGDNRSYVMDMIRLGVSHGVCMMWTDTNIFGTNGVLYDWLTQDDKLSGLMREYKEYISLMTKESYGSEAANTDALFKGLWMTDYCENWGIASDWWHWQLDSNGALFDAGSGGDAWKQCLTWPENMYTQDVVRAVSQGATCFKSEAQWYSNATKGMRTPTYQYSMIPFLKKLVNKEVKIPTKEEMLERTKAIVVGAENWNNFNFDTTYSNLYPKTGQYGIVPYVPSNCPDEELAGYDLVVKENLGKAGLKSALDAVYPVQKSEGTAYCETFGDTWYWMNSSEDKNVNQYTEFTTAINGSESVKIAGEPHVFGIIKEKPEALNVYLSNYRLDKTELWDGTIPGGLSDQGCYNYVWQMCERMKNGTGLDTQLRDTVITVKNAVEPKVNFVTVSPADRSFAEDNYVRPYKYTVAQKEGTTDEWVITVSHNGIVEFNIVTGDDKVPATSVELSTDKVDVIRNRTAVVKATVLPQNAGNKQLTWSIANPEIASVDNKGTVTGLKEGKTVLRASISDSVYKECEVNVIDRKVTAVNLNKTELSLNAGDSAKLEATVAPADPSDSSITWTSSNENVATVASNGTVTAHKAGVAQIIAQSAYQAKGIATVTVNYAPSVKLDRTGMTASANSEQSKSGGEGPASNVLDGKQDTLWHTNWTDTPDLHPHWIKVDLNGTKTINKFAYTPRTGASNGTIYKYVLIISDPEGNEKQVAKGVWAANADVKYAEFDAVEATAIKLQVDGNDATASKGGYGSAAEINIFEVAQKPSANELAENIKIIAPVKPEDTKVSVPVINGYDITISNSSNPEVIGIDGGIIRPENDTVVTLTLKVKETDSKAVKAAGTEATTNVDVLVTGTKSADVEAESVTLDKTSADLTVGEELLLNAVVKPDNTTNKAVTWSSDKPAVATVENGKVKAIAAGEARITAATANGKTAVCNVTVKAEDEPEVILPTEVRLNIPSAEFTVGDQLQLTASVLPANAADKSITWKSDKPDVATVANGWVKGIAAGTAKITATSVNGKTAVCVITVKAQPQNLPTGVSLNKKTASVNLNKTLTLSAVVQPSNADNKTVKWASDNTHVATVENGIVKAVNAGTARITATTVNGHKATCTITVPGTKISKAKVSLASSKNHTGKALKPSVKVTYGKKTLKKNTDYSVSFKNNINPGTASVTITGKGKYYGTIQKTFAIKAAEGKTYTVGKGKYKVTDASAKNRTVTFMAPVKKTYSSFSVPSKVKIGNDTYKVTAVAKNAFRKNTKLTSVTIGSNVKTIGSYAFYGVSQLKSITIKSAKLTSAGKNVFKKTNAKMTVKVPKTKLADYKKLLKGKGLSSKAKIQKQ